MEPVDAQAGEDLTATRHEGRRLRHHNRPRPRSADIPPPATGPGTESVAEIVGTLDVPTLGVALANVFVPKDAVKLGEEKLPVDGEDVTGRLCEEVVPLLPPELVCALQRWYH